MAGHAAARGQHARRRMHAVDVLGTGFGPDHHHRHAFRRLPFRLVRGEHDRARHSARTGRQPFREQLPLGSRIEHRMQQLVERGGIDASDRLVPADQTLAGHIDGDAQCRGRSPFARACLQHIERAALHGELQVLHVTVMPLKDVADTFKRRVGPRQRRFHRRLIRSCAPPRHRLRGADARHDVLALRIGQVLTIEDVLARRWIAGEAHAGGAAFSHVAEHHRLDADRRAPLNRDVIKPPVGVGARVRPGCEHRRNRAPQLRARILRKRRAGLCCDQVQILGHHLLPVFGLEFGVVEQPGVELELFDDLLEPVVLDAEHDRAVHLHEPPVAVPREARIARPGRQAHHRAIVETEIEHGVHHAGHRHPCSRSHRHQQRPVIVAEAEARRALDVGERFVDLAFERLRIMSGAVEGGAERGGEREAGRNRQPEGRHFGQVGGLVAEQIAHRRAALVASGAEAINPLGHRTMSFPCRAGPGRAPRSFMVDRSPAARAGARS